MPGPIQKIPEQTTGYYSLLLEFPVDYKAHHQQGNFVSTTCKLYSFQQSCPKD